MGRYIDEILQPGEKVLYSTNAHWMFYLPAIAAWILALVLLILSRTTITEGIVLLCLSASAIVAIVALYWTVKAWFHRWTTETDVTNLRVVHKTGFIKRRTFEMSLDKVESVDVNQSILGRLLNYGDVTILGVGEGKRNHLHDCLATRISQFHHRAIGAARTPWPCSRIHPSNPPPLRGPRSTRPRSRSSRNCRRNGGIPRARWRRCTRSIRCG